MKNKFLLLGATAILSMEVMMVKAQTVESNSVKMSVGASFISPITAEVTNNLFFGTFVADSGGTTLTVNSDGSIVNHDAKVLWKGALTGYDSNGEVVFTVTSGELESHDVELPTSVAVKASENLCGTAKAFTRTITTNNEDYTITVKIGATFETANVKSWMEDGSTRDCWGSATITLVRTSAI